MGKNHLQDSKMSNAYLDEARLWANDLVQRESRGNGDTENAMRRLEQRFGISWRTFWSLRYRPPKDILIGTYLGLKNAYEAECERQMALLRHELELTKAKGVSGASVDAAEAWVRALDEAGNER